MIDCKFYSREFSKYGINNFQCWGNVIALDKVFGLDESKHNDGIDPYGVSTLSLFERGLSINYYKGNIFKEYTACTNGRMGERKNTRLLTEAEEKGVITYMDNLISERKKQIEERKYWIEHFADFLNDALKKVNEYISNHKLDREYKAKLTYGASLADPTKSNAILIQYDDKSQRGYIKIVQNEFGDITFDAYCMCHISWKIKNPNDIDEDIKKACGWIM